MFTLNTLTLVGVNIEGEWNVPLLDSAAEVSGAALVLARDDDPAMSAGGPPLADAPLPKVDELLTQFDHVVACEAAKRSQSVYECATPRGRLAVIVGNELRGVSKRLLKKADQVVSVPMLGRGITSVNVAAAAAIALYALERDLGRKRLRASALCQRDVDVLISGPSDPSELGSLLRSAWAFGWRRVFLEDRHAVWFTSDRATVLAGRAAARRETNPLAVVPWQEMDLRQYNRILVCNGRSPGTPLSRFSLPSSGKVLLVYGDARSFSVPPAEPVCVDYAVPGATARFRNTGSILLSVVSQLLRRQWRG
jgi:hypothetical protein